MLLNFIYLPLVVPFCAVYTIWGGSKWDAFYRFTLCCRSHKKRDEISLIATRYGLIKYQADNLVMHELQQEIIKEQIATDKFWLEASFFALTQTIGAFSSVYISELRKTLNDEKEKNTQLTDEELYLNQLRDLSELLYVESEKYISCLKNRSSTHKKDRCSVRFLIVYNELFNYYCEIKEPETAKRLFGVFLHRITCGLLLFYKMKRINSASSIQKIAVESICLGIDRYGVEYVKDISNVPLLSRFVNKEEEIDIIGPFFYYLCQCIVNSLLELWMPDYSEKTISMYEKALSLLQIYDKSYSKFEENKDEEGFLINYIKLLKGFSKLK